MKNKFIEIEEIKEFLEDMNINMYIDTYFQRRRNYSNNEEYKDLKKEYDNLYNQLQKNFSDEDKINFDSLTGIIREIEGMESRLAYKIGLIEGITIKKEIDNI